MPSVEMGPLHLVDHLIRVHPEQKTQISEHGNDLRSRVRPMSAYLRIIVTNTSKAAATAKERLSHGEAFYPVARETSVDPTASIGGYLGRKNISDLSRDLRDTAAGLNYGETSAIAQSNGKWMILQRLPRDFRWSAEQVERQAEDLGARGEAAAAIEKAQQALMIYPHFLRALNFIGMTLANNGNPKKGADVLRIAAKLYPEDAGTRYSLAALLMQLGDSATAKGFYEQAIKLEPDFTAAYANLGMLSYQAGDWQGAASTFRQGLQIDPLSAELYYDLGLALERGGDRAGATQANSLANRLKLVAPSVDSDIPAQLHHSGSF